MKVSELAERAGVSVATIKYYIREGLLPPPPLKTGRTMGYYDRAYLERLIAIRKLREEHFLPIRVIRTILEEHGDQPLTRLEATVLARVDDRVTRRLAPARRPALGREELLARYHLRPDELELLEAMGLTDDLELMEALQRAEGEGLSRDRFPLEGLGHYVELLGELARREVRLFLKHAAAHVPEGELEGLAERAVELTEPILNLLRKRLILREIKRLTGAKGPREES
jgi:DNA-binding transcriptional MerR regulator